MATPSENALLIALNTLAVLLDAKGLVSKQEFVDGLELEKKGRPDEIVDILDEIARQYVPKSRPTLRAIDGGKAEGDEDNDT